MSDETSGAGEELVKFLDEAIKQRLKDMRDAAGGGDTPASFIWSDEPHRLVYDAVTVASELLVRAQAAEALVPALLQRAREAEEARDALGDVLERAWASEAKMAEAARLVVGNLLTLIDTDPVWRASGFAKDARAFLASPVDVGAPDPKASE